MVFDEFLQPHIMGCTVGRNTEDEPAERVAARSLGREPQVPAHERASLRSGRQRGGAGTRESPTSGARCRPLRGLEARGRAVLGVAPQATRVHPLRGFVSSGSNKAAYGIRRGRTYLSKTIMPGIRPMSHD